MISKESVIIKTKLFFNMLIAANTAALAIKLSMFLADVNVDYFACLGVFLSLRVILFMANPNMPLNDKNVAFMSSERILWNTSTILISAIMIPILALLSLL